ncbi:hypothetical protein [Ktedonospora formicarum]|uniref:Uncharacterized protein n=1 Tax=Ktedonospora formicarum TaxID=2778364 RepID=A0A8J3MV81_9CHLR|nr:hypothetical protein [Ktedonospora formicarum]GHO46235.1 hypothetical protein KSX_43980 [Ktedonospora formicarum]
MTRRKSEQQPQLFATYSYSWKSIQQLKIKDIIVVGDEEARVNVIKQDEEEVSWLVTYVILQSNERGEQIYFAHDNIYARKDE